jgi:hypothetical protein
MPSQATYRRRKAAGLCPVCGGPRNRALQICCTTCSSQGTAEKRAWYATHKTRVQATARAAQEARWEAPGANLVACCNTWHPVPTLPYQLPCCGKILALIKEDAHAPA